MHPNPAFRRVDAAQSLALVRARSFGILLAQGAEGPLASHIPFMLSDDGSVVEFHLVRNSAMARTIADGAPQRKNGRMTASDAPGLGISPRMDVLGTPVLVI